AACKLGSLLLTAIDDDSEHDHCESTGDDLNGMCTRHWRFLLSLEPRRFFPTAATGPYLVAAAILRTWLYLALHLGNTPSNHRVMSTVVYFSGSFRQRRGSLPL